jgi:glycosyltransferase involved in cell wall biosynthesis
MIVKNESQVIERCLSSVLPIIDYWVIVDTGSTDGTQQIIKEFMHKKGVPGELFERPWVNFGHNRNEAMNLAKGKANYLLFIDADEYLVYDSDFKLPNLDRDYYYVAISHSGTKYDRIHLINSNLNCSWIGVLHEVLCPSFTDSFATLEKVVNIYTTEGARSKDPQKYQKDAQILETALKDDPNNSRYVFYLAQSYRDAKDYSQALKNYEKRASMDGWDEETFYSLYQIGAMQEFLEMPTDTVIKSYVKAYQYRKSRVEPLFQIVRLFRLKEDFNSGYLAAQIAQTLPVSKDHLIVEHWIYDYGLPLELSICAYWLGKYEECQKISVELLKKDTLPSDIRECVENNLGFANAKLLENLTSKNN